MSAFGLNNLAQDPLFLAFAIAIVAVGLVLGLTLTGGNGNHKARLQRRMQDLVNGGGFDLIADDEQTAELLRKKPISDKSAIQNKLAQAGGTKVVPLMILAGICMALLVVAIATFAINPPWFLKLVLAVGGFLIGANTLLKRRIAKRQTAFLDAFPDAIDLIVRAVRAGIPVNETLGLVATEGSAPVSDEFRTIAEEIAVGVDLGDACTNAVHRIGIPDFNFFVVSLMLQRETGGHLAETLDNLSNVVRRRKEMRLKIRALTSEGRISAKILSGMPLVTIAAIAALQPEYMLPMLDDPLGRLILTGAGLSIAFGVFLTYRMTRISE